MRWIFCWPFQIDSLSLCSSGQTCPHISGLPCPPAPSGDWTLRLPYRQKGRRQSQTKSLISTPPSRKDPTGQLSRRPGSSGWPPPRPFRLQVLLTTPSFGLFRPAGGDGTAWLPALGCVLGWALSHIPCPYLSLHVGR